MFCKCSTRHLHACGESNQERDCVQQAVCRQGRFCPASGALAGTCASWLKRLAAFPHQGNGHPAGTLFRNRQSGDRAADLFSVYQHWFLNLGPFVRNQSKSFLFKQLRKQRVLSGNSNDLEVTAVLVLLNKPLSGGKASPLCNVKGFVSAYGSALTSGD